MFYLCHIRKTGGRSVIRSFLSTTGQDPDELHKQMSKAAHRKINVDGKIFAGWSEIFHSNVFFGHSHSPVYKVRLPKNVKKIVCLRNPKSRILSLYNFFTDIKNGPKSAHSGSKELKWLGKSFDDFLNNIPKYELYATIKMFSNSYSVTEATNEIRSCYHKIFTDTMKEDLKDLSRKTGLNFKYIHRGKSSHRAKITKGQKERLMEILRPEYELMKMIGKDYN